MEGKRVSESSHDNSKVVSHVNYLLEFLRTLPPYIHSNFLVIPEVLGQLYFHFILDGTMWGCCCDQCSSEQLWISSFIRFCLRDVDALCCYVLRAPDVVGGRAEAWTFVLQKKGRGRFILGGTWDVFSFPALWLWANLRSVFIKVRNLISSTSCITTLGPGLCS